MKINIILFLGLISFAFLEECWEKENVGSKKECHSLSTTDMKCCYTDYVDRDGKQYKDCEEYTLAGASMVPEQIKAEKKLIESYEKATGEKVKAKTNKIDCKGSYLVLGLIGVLTLLF